MCSSSPALWCLFALEKVFAASQNVNLSKRQRKNRSPPHLSSTFCNVVVTNNKSPPPASTYKKVVVEETQHFTPQHLNAKAQIPLNPFFNSLGVHVSSGSSEATSRSLQQTN